MMLTHSVTGNVLVLTAKTDRIDAANAIHLKDEFRDATSGFAGRVVMDLSSVKFMDSSGLGAMVAALKTLSGRKLELAEMSVTVDKVFRLTRMDKVFVLHDTLSDALSVPAKGTDAA